MNNNAMSRFPIISVLQGRPAAIAQIAGSDSYPQITGTVRLYTHEQGVLLYAQINGLPETEQKCEGRFFGFHIHEGRACTGTIKDPFAESKSHYNPDDCRHPDHAGDLPPLLGNDGLAVMAVLTDRFSVDEAIGKTVVIHDRPDDFTSQPAGNAGTKIACGVIRRNA